MSGLRIEWLYDDCDCDTCGGNYASGAVVKLDNITILNLQPKTTCFGGDSWDEVDVYKLIIKQLGFTITEE